MPPRFLAVLLLAGGVIARGETPTESAIALYRAKDFPAAKSAFEQLAATEPNNAETQFYLGVIAQRQADVDVAIQHLEHATQLNPANSTYMLELGGAYGMAAKKAGLLSKMTWAKKCVAALEQAVALDPESLIARNGLITYYREAPSFVGGGIDKAYVQAEEIRKRDPIMGAAILVQLYASEKKWDKAFETYDDALKAHPDSYNLLFGLGRGSAQSGLFLERGEQALRRCLELTPGKGEPGPAAVRWRLGNIAELKKDLPSARAEYEASLKADPSFEAASASLAKLSPE
ncbi:MAG: tetratricopeptide repeat protein [Opitutus sp.]